MTTAPEGGRVTNVLMCGVGGQGVILASDILAEAAMLAGHDVKKSEVHGMSQRGGSVVTHVRFGRTVHSPLIMKGEADILVAFELVEALRYLDHLSPEAVAIADEVKIVPTTVSSGPFKYPADPAALLKERVPTTLIDCTKVAKSLGSARMANTVLLGALSKKVDIPESVWREAISQKVPKGTVEANMRAFDEGRRRAGGP